MYDKITLIKQLSNGNPEEYKLELITKFEKQCIFFGYEDGWGRALCLLRKIKQYKRHNLEHDRSKFIDDLREEIAKNGLKCTK